MSRRGWLATGIAVAVVAIVALAVGLARRPQSGAPEVAPTPTVPLATARIGSFPLLVPAQGRVGPPAGSDAKLAFAEAGIVASIDVVVGARVSAGQVLATLDRASLQAAYDQAGADVAAAAAAHRAAAERGPTTATAGTSAATAAVRQAQLKVAADRAELAREQTLFAGGVAPRKDVEAAATALQSDLADVRAAMAKAASATVDQRAVGPALAADAAQVASAQARLDAARVAYENGLLRAPSDGLVVALLKHPGEGVDAGTPVIAVGPPNEREVTFSLPAATAQRIKPGDAASVTDSQNGETASGRVVAIVPAVDPATQVASVVATGVPADALAGDAIDGTIAVGEARGVIVPSSAVVQDPQTGDSVVFVLRSAKPGEAAFSARPVVIGAASERFAEIRAGLHAGERVAAQGGYELLAPSGG